MAIPKPPIAKLLIQDGVTANTDTGKAEHLARFFAGQCSSESLNEDLDIGAPYPSKINKPIFDFQPISESLVLHLLQTLSTSKAYGCTVLTNWVLREFAPFIAPSLTYLYNFSVSTDTFRTIGKLQLLHLSSRIKAASRIQQIIDLYRFSLQLESSSI